MDLGPRSAEPVFVAASGCRIRRVTEPVRIAVVLAFIMTIPSGNAFIDVPLINTIVADITMEVDDG
jgi:hypothetical protein